jgi:hypothetical protein
MYTAPTVVSLQIDTFGSDYDTQLLVHGGACGAETGPLECNDDDWPNFGSGTSRALVTLAAGESALIEVRSRGGGTSLTLNVTESPVFRVTPFAEYRNQRPAIARRGDEFLILWESVEEDGIGVETRRYDASGTALAPALAVAGAAARDVDVAATPSGFVATWTRSFTGIAGQLLDTTGAPSGGEFSIDTGNNYPAAVAAGPAGNFMVVWHTLGSLGIRGRAFDALGTPLGASFQVNTSSTSYARGTDIAAGADGTFVVVWRDETAADPSDGIVARRFDADGTPLGGELQVNTYTPGSQRYPAVAAGSDGSFVVVWADLGLDCGYCIDARRLDAAGTPVGPVVRLGEDDTGTPGSTEGSPLDVAADASGNFVVVWPGADLKVLAQRLGPDGVPLGAAPFAVSHLSDGYQYHPAVAATPAGDFVVTWDWSPYGSRFDLMGRHVTAIGAGLCTVVPRDAADCRQPIVAAKSKLTVRDRDPDTSDSFAWKLVRSEAATPADLGDPVATHSYAFCLYDATGLTMEQAVGPGGTCGAKPCWNAFGAGYRYIDKQGVRGPVRKLVAVPGADGEAKVIVKAKGQALAMPALPLTPSVRAQLQVTNGECWDVEYDAADVRLSGASDFKAAGP